MSGLRKTIYPTGLTVWRLPDQWLMHIMWIGPGAGLRLCIGDPADGSTAIGTAIEHPSASGTYDSRREAETAVRAFVAADGRKGGQS
jgi:hypothetical protein